MIRYITNDEIFIVNDEIFVENDGIFITNDGIIPVEGKNSGGSYRVFTTHNF